VLVVGAVFYMYRAGARAPGGPPQAVGAPLGDVRAPAPPQPAAADPSAGLTISKDDAGGASPSPTLAPPPEQPLPPPAAESPLPPPPPPPRGAEATAAPSSAGQAAPRGNEPPDTIGGLIASAARPQAPAKSPANAKAAAAAKPADGPAVVQIGAFSSEALADEEWSKAAAVAPGAMAGKGKRVAPLTKDGETLYRTSITGFASRGEALALCDRLKTAGGTCFVR
jgi:hypothetical protein